MAIGIAALAFSCSSSSNDAQLAALTAGCVVNSDCYQPLVCAFKTCHDKCVSSRDCPENELCVISDKPYHVCQFPSEATCQTNADCAGSEVCGPDDHCRDQCKVDRDCLLNQVCQTGVCVDISMPLDASVGEAGATGFPCQYNHDCPAPLVCRQGACEIECTIDRDCALGYVCVADQCTPATVQPPPPVDGSFAGGDGSVPMGGGCRSTPDCAPPLLCKDGTCEPQCTLSIDCPGGDLCVKNACVPSVPPGSADGGPPMFDGAVPDGAPSGFGSGCRTNADCQNTLLCVSGVCIYQCNNNFDCDTAHDYCCAPWHACVTGLACFQNLPDASVSVCQGLSCPIVATNQIKPTAIVVDTGYVYWTDYDPTAGAIRACALGASCGASPMNLATGQNTPSALTLTPSQVWWVTYTARGLWTAQKPPLDAGGPAEPDGTPGPQTNSVVAYGSGFVTLQLAGMYFFDQAGHYTSRSASSPLPSALTLAPDGDSLYWIESRATTDIAFKSIFLDSYAVLWSEPNIAVVTADDDWLYWGTTGPGAHIAGGPRSGPDADGGGYTILASATEPKGIAFDAQYVYWTDYSDGTVNRVPKRGGAVLTLASSLSLPWGIAVSRTGVYWTNAGDGTVMWLAQ